MSNCKGFLLCRANEVLEPRSGSIHFRPSCVLRTLMKDARRGRIR
jgi:hypothetical protein